MKIIVIGDFHGKLSQKLLNRIKKEKPDIVISLGDYFPFHYREIWFKYCYGKQTNLWEIIGKKKYKEIMLKDLKMGEPILKKLNSLPCPIFTLIGNIDYTRVNDSVNQKKYGKEEWEWDKQDFFKKIIKKYKNIKRFDYSYFKFEDYIFIGAFGGTSPGEVKSKEYKRYRKKLDKLFKKFSNENKNKKVIFISHNVPYNTKLDIIRNSTAGEIVEGKHYGSKMIRRIIEKYQPKLHIGGHMHENQGKDKIKKTILLNPGAAVENKMAIIELNTKKNPKIKLIK